MQSFPVMFLHFTEQGHVWKEFCSGSFPDKDPVTLQTNCREGSGVNANRNIAKTVSENIHRYRLLIYHVDFGR